MYSYKNIEIGEANFLEYKGTLFSDTLESSYRLESVPSSLKSWGSSLK